jgi:ATP/maltotriose-dependent transcriptional regulator MalT
LNVGYQLMALGDLERSEQLLTETLRVAERLGLWTVVAYAEHNLGLVAAVLGRFKLGSDLENSAARRAAALQEPLLEGYAFMYLAEIALMSGDPERAENDARRAITILEHTPVHLAPAHAALSQALLARDRVDDALSEARVALELFESAGGPDENEARVRLAYARACHAAGDLNAARAAIERARSRLMERAERIEDPELRRSLLERSPHSAKTLELHELWSKKILTV